MLAVGRFTGTQAELQQLTPDVGLRAAVTLYDDVWQLPVFTVGDVVSDPDFPWMVMLRNLAGTYCLVTNTVHNGQAEWTPHPSLVDILQVTDTQEKP